MKKHTFLKALSAIAGVTFALPVSAAVIITPTTATSTSTIGAPRTIDATFDGAPLSSGGTSGDILSETAGGAGSSGHWLSAISAIDDDANFRSTTEVLTFTLAAATDLDTIHLWTYNRSERARGLRTFDISFSTDGGGTFPTTISAATLGDFTIGSTGSATPVQSKTFATQSGVTDIRFTNLTTFGSTNYIGVSELRFGSSVPETSSVALFSLAGLGWLIRRRR